TTYECSLHGLVPDHMYPALMDRLVSLCGGEDMRQPLTQHILGLVPTVQTPPGPMRNDDVVLRLQSEVGPDCDPQNLHIRKWFLCQQGHPDPHMSTVAT
ncbi:hypothetical protein BJ085DRAFT_1328, partial [Dimargaris cristalligena]